MSEEIDAMPIEQVILEFLELHTYINFLSEFMNNNKDIQKRWKEFLRMKQ